MVQIIAEDEVLESCYFQVLNGFSIGHVEARATVRRFRKQTVPTTVLLRGASRAVTGLAQLPPVPRNVRVHGALCQAATGVVVAETVAVTALEGAQALPLLWPSADLPVGQYVMRVSAPPWAEEVSCDLRVVEEVQLDKAVVCRGIDDALRPEEMTTSYVANDTFTCCITTGPAPAYTSIRAEWYAGAERIDVSSMAHAMRSGRQRVAFRLIPPPQGWESGNYRVVVRLGRSRRTVAFRVAAS
jgi:hypothetical protein